MQSIAGEKPHTTNNANHLRKGKKESRTYWHWSRTFIVQYLYKVLVGRVGRTAVQNQHVIPSKGCQNAASPISTLGRLWRECQGFFLLYLLEFYNIQKFIEKKGGFKQFNPSKYHTRIQGSNGKVLTRSFKEKSKQTSKRNHSFCMCKPKSRLFIISRSMFLYKIHRQH